MTKTPTRETDAWGTLVSSHQSVLQQWFPLTDGWRRQKKAGKSPGHPAQIQCITDNVDSGRTVSYAYDALYRLASATTNGSANYVKWGLTWSYDRYGNVLAENQAYDTPPHFSVSVDATTNRITGSPYAYDANGNMTNDGNNTLVYDAENRVLSATNGSASGTYTYDGNNLRVKKVSGSTTTVYIFSGAKVIAEYVGGALPASPTREYIYSGGALLAKIDSSGTKYYHQDHLSNRVVTDSSGNSVAQLGHYPFGESWYNTSSEKWLFTSYERDSESGNDYAMMRSYVNRLGRFSSPDLLVGFVTNPQSLSLYPYVRSDPTDLIDTWGLCDNGYGVTISIGGTPQGPEGIYGGILCPNGSSDSTTGLPLIYRPNAGGGGGNTSGLPQQRSKLSETLTRAKTCAKAYYGFNTLPGAATDVTRVGTLIAAAPLPKSWLSTLGIRTTTLAGGSSFTNILSVLGQGAGTAASGANLLRIAGRVAVPIAIASAAIDATAIAVCTLTD